jgi:hypothetical protein
VICERCQQLIREGEARTTFTPDTGSGVTPTVYMHSRNCQPVPHQSAPEDGVR